MILAACDIPRTIVHPFEPRTRHANGMTYGLSGCGYDIRLRQAVDLPAGGFTLASSLERFAMPRDVVGIVHDKSTLARMGLSVFNTVIEPGWCGWLTLELANRGEKLIHLQAGAPIAQVLFSRTSSPCQPYAGRYQDQPDEPVQAKWRGA